MQRQRWRGIENDGPSKRVRSERRRPEPVLLVLGASAAAGAAPEAGLGDVEHAEGDGRLWAKGGVSAPTSPPFLSDESH